MANKETAELRPSQKRSRPLNFLSGCFKVIQVIQSVFKLIEMGVNLYNKIKDYF